jgi:Cyclin
MINSYSGSNSWNDGKCSSIQAYYKYYESLGMKVPKKDTIVEKISEILIAITTSNEENTCQKTLFEAATKPKIGIQAYVDRINKYSLCSTESYIYSLIYIDRYNYCH